MEATTVNLTSTQPGGKEITKAITYINPNAADSSTAKVMAALSSLSKNTLTRIQKVAKTDLEIPQD